LTQVVASQTLALDERMGKRSGGQNLYLSLGVGRGRRMKMNEELKASGFSISATLPSMKLVKIKSNQRSQHDMT
jgi:hypothetical protein